MGFGLPAGGIVKKKGADPCGSAPISYPRLGDFNFETCFLVVNNGTAIRTTMNVKFAFPERGLE